MNKISGWHQPAKKTTEGGKMRIYDLMENWLQAKKSEVKQSTFELYKYQVQHYIKPHVKNEPCFKVCTETIESLLNILYLLIEENRLKVSTSNNLIVRINQILSYGNKYGYIKKQIKLKKIKQKKSKEVDILQKSAIKKLHSHLIKNLTGKNFGILLCLYTGLRIGELCALKWSDIDTTQGIITIRKTMQRINRITDAENSKRTQIIISSPKTQNSLRQIPLPVQLNNFIRKIKGQENTFILTNSEKFFEPRSFRRYYTNTCKKLSINGEHVHTLRHTFATFLIQNGTDYKTVSEILGHSNIKITLDLYVHPSIEEKKKCISSLFKQISG